VERRYPFLVGPGDVALTQQMMPEDPVDMHVIEDPLRSKRHDRLFGHGKRTRVAATVFNAEIDCPQEV